MAYGAFPNPRTAINQFVFQQLVYCSLEREAPRSINLSQQFAAFLADNGLNRYSAEEEAENKMVLVKRRVSEVLSEWSDLGVGAPLGFSDNDDLLFTWRHPKSSEITGREFISRKFVMTYDWLSRLNSREFLLAGAMFLKALRCDPIFVTDGPNDGGIDCIGRLSDGPLRSVIVFVQVKTREDRYAQIGRDLVVQEYGKYASLPKTEKYRDYLNALQFDTLRDGCGPIYVMVSNVEFNHDGQVLGRNLGIVLRSRRQMAHILSHHFSYRRLVDARREVEISSRPDLGTNLSPVLHRFLYNRWR